MKITSISASAIKTFETCPKKFYYEYVLKKRIEPHPAAAMGSAVHYMFEKSCKALVLRDEDKEKKNPFYWYDQAIKEFKVKEEYIQTLKDLTNTCINWGYMNCDNAQGFEVEAKFNLPNNIQCRGFIDRLDIDPQLRADIIDLKTQKDKFTQAELNDNWQAIIYFLATLNDNPMIQGDVNISFWVLRHKIQSLKIPQSRFNELFDKLCKKTDEILKSDGDKCNPSGLCRFCVADDCIHKKAGIKVKNFDKQDMSVDVKSVRDFLSQLKGKQAKKEEPAKDIESDINSF